MKKIVICLILSFLLSDFLYAGASNYIVAGKIYNLN